MEINCKFNTKNDEDRNEEIYFCSIEEPDKEIPDNDDMLKFVGKHIEGKTNQDVKEVLLNGRKFTKFPQGLANTFPNLEVLQFHYSNIKTLTKEDLKGLEKLKKIWIDFSLLEYLPGNLFEDTKNLESISFFENKLKYIEKDLLDNLENLKFVDFSLNININKRWDSIENKGNSTLDKIKQHILENCVPDYLAIFKKTVIDLEERVKNHKKKIEELEKDHESRKRIIIIDMKEALTNENYKDCTVKIEDEEFKVHKFLLAARSPTFDELFIKNPDVNEFKIGDISVESFKILLDFIYNYRLPDNSNCELNYCDIFKMAARMKIKELKEFAASNLMERLDNENAFEMLVLANKHDHEELREKAFEEIRKIFPDKTISDELSKHPDKVEFLINEKKENEEAIRAAKQRYDEAFKNV